MPISPISVAAGLLVYENFVPKKTLHAAGPGKCSYARVFSTGHMPNE